MPARRSVTTVVLTLIALVASLLVGSTAARAAVGVTLTPYEQALTTMVNRARHDAGLPSLTVAPGLTDVARTWSVELARSGHLRHNPALAPQVVSHGSRNWGVLAENVGFSSEAGNPQHVFDAYMNSREHRDNILRAGVAYIGTGAVRDGAGRVWNTMNFVAAVDGSYPTSRVRGDAFAVGGPPSAGTAGVFLSDSATSGVSTSIVAAPGGARRAVACDFTGDGRAGIALFTGGIWTLLSRSGAPTATFSFGRPGDQPLCGDWDGNGRASIGVYRDGDVYLRNATGPGPSDVAFRFGSPGDVAFAGDWNSDGRDTLGVDRRGIKYLTNSSVRPVTTTQFSFGRPGDTTVAGDFNADGTSTLAVVRNNIWYVSSGNRSAPAAPGVAYGRPTDTKLVGDWSGRGAAGIGVYRG